MTVILLPVLVVNDVGMGDPFFCKYICPVSYTHLDVYKRQGRSPKDKFIVMDENSKDTVWWLSLIQI